MKDNFPPQFNPHYDFAHTANRAEILAVESYDLAGDRAQYTAGQVVDSPWGANQVTGFDVSGGIETCTKEITVKPGYMLSLQRHRGRRETWDVLHGTLTVILDGVRYDVTAGQGIDIPQGAVHCMINTSAAPVTVRETQVGICREKDNIRLVDFSNRPTYPLTSEAEFRSALLYADIQKDLFERYGTGCAPDEKLLAANRG